MAASTRSKPADRRLLRPPETGPVKLACSCSPTTHPGSFRCSLHKGGAAGGGGGGRSHRGVSSRLPDPPRPLLRPRPPLPRRPAPPPAAGDRPRQARLLVLPHHPPRLLPMQPPQKGSHRGVSSRLNARRSATTNSLVRIGIGTVEGEWVRRALAALIWPSSHQQRRWSAFRPRPSRLSLMSKAGD